MTASSLGPISPADSVYLMFCSILLLISIGIDPAILELYLDWKSEKPMNESMRPIPGFQRLPCTIQRTSQFECTPSFPKSYIFVHQWSKLGAAPNMCRLGWIKDVYLLSLCLIFANVPEVYELCFTDVSNESLPHGWILKFVRENFLPHVRQWQCTADGPYSNWDTLKAFSGRDNLHEALFQIIYGVYRCSENIIDSVPKFLSHSLRVLLPEGAISIGQISNYQYQSGGFELSPSSTCQVYVLLRADDLPSPNDINAVSNSTLFNLCKDGFKARYISMNCPYTGDRYSFIRHREDHFSKWWCVDGSNKNQKRHGFHALNRRLILRDLIRPVPVSFEDCNLTSDVGKYWDIIVYVRSSLDKDTISRNLYSSMGGHPNVICKEHMLPLVQCNKRCELRCTFCDDCGSRAHFRCIWSCNAAICKKQLKLELKRIKDQSDRFVLIPPGSIQDSHQDLSDESVSDEESSSSDESDANTPPEDEHIITSSCPLSLQEGYNEDDVYRTDAWQHVPSHFSSISDDTNPNTPSRCTVPTTYVSGNVAPKTCRQGRSYLGVHTVINMRGQCLIRRNNDLSFSQYEKSALQDIVSTTGDACCLSYPEAMLFPDIFWNGWSDGTMIGAIPGCLLTDQKRSEVTNIAGFHTHLICRICNPLLSIAGNSRYVFFGYDVLSNINLRGTDDRTVISRGLREVNPGLKVLNEGNSVNNVHSCDVIDSQRSVKCLAAMLREYLAGYFITITCNQKDFPGMKQFYKIKKALLLTVREDDTLSAVVKDELENCIEKLTAFQQTRSWQVCIETIIRYITTSSDEVMGRFCDHFGRLENQENEFKVSGTNSHLHLISFPAPDPSNKAAVDEHYHRVRASSRALFHHDDIEKLIHMGIIANEEEAEELRRDSRVLQVHDCKRAGNRCKKRLADGTEICRYTDYYEQNPKQVYGFILVSMEHSDRATAILCDLNFLSRGPDNETIIVLENRLKALKHLYPADKGEKFTPTNPFLFALTRSDCNVLVCGYYMSSRYLANYVASIDDVSIHVAYHFDDCIF